MKTIFYILTLTFILSSCTVNKQVTQLESELGDLRQLCDKYEQEILNLKDTIAVYKK
jgi:cell division protein FtsB